MVDGAQGLSDAFGHYRHESLRNSLQRTTDVDVHHTYFRYAWRREQDGHVTMEGWSFGWLDTDGQTSPHRLVRWSRSRSTHIGELVAPFFG